MKRQDEKDKRRKRTKREANFTGKKGQSRGVGGDGIQKQEN
jgi:hypothetical protein